MAHKPRLFKPAHSTASEPSQEGYEARRGSARSRGYTASWDRAAHSHLCDHPLCLGCEAVGVVTPATLVDHVEPHKGDMVKFWNQDMWQSSCKWHHDVVKQQMEAMFARGQITISDLRLDSALARRLTRLRQPAAG